MATSNGTTKKTTAKKTTQAAEKAAADAVKMSEDAMKAGEDAMKAGADAMKENFEKAFGATRERMDTAMKGLNDMSSYNRDNVDAMVAASTVFAKGMEAVSAEVMAISKRNMEDTVAAMKALSGVKSAKEYFELQSDFAKTAWDNMVADGTKIGEMTLLA